jgi:AICAR transformylase/IMP cyclohydrolase PurH
LTSAYDAAVSRYLLDEDFPDFWNESLKKAQDLRYGENGHQKAALYLHTDRNGALSNMEFLGGKELSYNNVRDLDLAWKVACAYGLPSAGELPFGRADSERVLPDVAFVQSACCVAVKHNTPCGIALGATVEEAFSKAYLCDPVSIFGGIVACNVQVTEGLAKKLGELFLEIVVAPDYESGALEILRRKKNLRIIKAVLPPKDAFESVSVDGGLLVQDVNLKNPHRRINRCENRIEREGVDRKREQVLRIIGIILKIVITGKKTYRQNEQQYVKKRLQLDHILRLNGCIGILFYGNRFQQFEQKIPPFGHRRYFYPFIRRMSAQNGRPTRDHV